MGASNFLGTRARSSSQNGLVRGTIDPRRGWNVLLISISCIMKLLKKEEPRGKEVDTMKTISIYRLAKDAGVQPQSLYTQAKLGNLKAQRTTCDHCGHTAWTVTQEVATEYLTKRAARLAKKDS